MKTLNPIVLDHGKLVPLTAGLLLEKVQRHNRIDLILLYAKLGHMDFVKALPLVNATHMQANRVLKLFEPWLGVVPAQPQPSKIRAILSALLRPPMRVSKAGVGSSYWA